MNNPVILEMTLTPVMEKQMLQAFQFMEDEIQSGHREVLPDGRIYYRITVEDQDKAKKAIRTTSLIRIIAKRHDEINDLLWLDNRIDELNECVGLKPETIKEIKTKISSRMAQIEISIRDHSKHLNDE